MKKGWNAGDNVRRDRKWLKRLGSIKTWQLLIVLIIFMMLSAIFLRLNNLGMIERRDAVIAADESGDIEQVQKKAAELQNYVSKHMNTYLGKGIALQNTYNLAVQKAMDSVKSPTIDSGAYQAATESCKPKLSQGGYTAYAQCVSDAVGSTPADDFKDPVLPNPAAYYLVYSPPAWSFDMAGLMLLICLIIIVIIAARLITMLILRLVLKFKYRSA